MKKAVLLLCFVPLFAAIGGGDDAIAAETHVGWLHGSCMAIRNDTITNGRQLWLLPLDGSTPIAATVVGRTASHEDCPLLLADRGAINNSDGRVFYHIRPTMADSIAIAVLAAPSVTVSGDHLFMHADKPPVRADYCYSGEGIVFSLWQERTNQLLWQDNYYLGYDVETTCSDE